MSLLKEASSNAVGINKSFCVTSLSNNVDDCFQMEEKHVTIQNNVILKWKTILVIEMFASRMLEGKVGVRLLKCLPGKCLRVKTLTDEPF